jgi:hypothetical protein
MLGTWWGWDLVFVERKEPESAPVVRHIHPSTERVTYAAVKVLDLLREVERV